MYVPGDASGMGRGSPGPSAYSPRFSMLDGVFTSDKACAPSFPFGGGGPEAAPSTRVPGPGAYDIASTSTGKQALSTQATLPASSFGTEKLGGPQLDAGATRPGPGSHDLQRKWGAANGGEMAKACDFGTSQRGASDKVYTGHL